MPGIPSKTFELEIAPLWPKEAQGVPGGQIAGGLKAFLEPERWEKLQNQTVVPMGLRWRVAPNMGLPRAPFSVWRRDRRRGDPTDVKFTPAEVNTFHLGGGVYHVPTAPLYVLLVTVDNGNPAGALTVQALDTANNPILLQTVNVPANASRVVRFQHPFIGGFSFQGNNFQIKSVVGVTMQHFIDRKEEWELIEIVGLPARPGELGGYDPVPQGYPSGPKDPPEAAFDRLAVGQQFYLPLGTTLPSGVPVPPWEIPEPSEAVEELRGDSPSLLQRLDEMLRAVDTGAVPTQAEYRTDVPVPGIRQPEFPDKRTADGTMNVPLLGTVLLNAVADPWFALSSGFGTTDFPDFLPASERFLEPATYFHVSHDYKVSAPFIFRLFGLEFKAGHCALSHRSLLPAFPPFGLGAAPYAQNRPARRDDPWSAEVALTWTKFNRFQIQGYAVAVAEEDPAGFFLNSLRPVIKSKKPALFVPAKPGEKGDPELKTRNRFFHHQALLPFVGTRTNRYGVAAMDAFGRWSDWRAADQVLPARLPEAPRLNGLALSPDKTRIAGNTAPHELVVEIVWDWQDRSPQHFELAAVFHRRRYFPDGTRDNGHLPPDTYPPGFQTDNSAVAGPLIGLTFPADVPPGTPPAFDALPTCPDPRVTIELLPQATNAGGQNVEGEMRRYRLHMADLNLAFAPDEEWYFTLFVKAAEWRNPGALSDTTLPLLPGRPPRMTAYVPNPIPAPPPVFIPATILWTALPDARGIARYRLSFDAVPHATGGYAVFQAYEAKLRDLAGLPQRNDPDLVGRATELRDLAMPLNQCLDAFTRLNARLIPPPAPGTLVAYEVEVPGTLDGLLAFAVASVTREQEVSGLSSPWLFVAVPRRAVPALPRLSLARHNGTATLTCVFPKAPKPARVEVLRARREFVARDADTMGLPLHESTEATWEPLNDLGLPAADAGETSYYRFSVNDPTVPSWFPYLYRAVAVGARDDVNGFLPGRSLQSNLVKTENLPATLPEMTGATGEQTVPPTVRLQFRSDAVVEATPHGSFRLEVFAWDYAANRFADTPVLTTLLPAAEPRPAGGVLAKNKLYYSGADAGGKRTFEALFDVTGKAFLFKMRLTDPLNRSAERMVSGKIEENEAPHLANLRTTREGRDLFLYFASTTRITRPAVGQYRLDISFTRLPMGNTIALLQRALHLIPAGNLNKLRLSPVTAILRAANTSPGAPHEYGAVIKNFYPPHPFPPRGRLQLLLTAPVGTVAKLARVI